MSVDHEDLVAAASRVPGATLEGELSSIVGVGATYNTAWHVIHPMPAPDGPHLGRLGRPLPPARTLRAMPEDATSADAEAPERQDDEAVDPPRPRDEGRATVALVLGIAAVILSWTTIPGIILGLLAIGFGATRFNTRSRRLARFGIALGVIGVVLGIWFSFVLFG